MLLTALEIAKILAVVIQNAPGAIEVVQRVRDGMGADTRAEFDAVMAKAKAGVAEDMARLAAS